MTRPNSLTKNFYFNLSPAPAWRAIIGLYLTIIIALVVAAPVLIIVFPLGSFAVGLLLFQRYPVMYVSFTWWMWFTTPLIRRLIDYQCGYTTPFPSELASILVTSISLATLVRYFPRIYKRDGLPFTLCIVTIIYGCAIGLIQKSITDPEREIIILLAWLAPVCFGFHLFANWRDYPAYRQNFLRTFFWLVLVTGVYAIAQFVFAPEWDRFFMLENNVPHLGLPEPLQIRVFSTMTGSVPFGINLMPGLILLLISQAKSRFLVAGVGYLAFLLARARTAWYTWFIALVVFAISLRRSQQIRIITGVVLIGLLVIPLMNIESFSQHITPAFESFSNLENDGSYQDRINQFQRSLNYALTQFVGYGLLSPEQAPTQSAIGTNMGDKNLFSFNDNGYLSLLVSFGWFGTIVYATGLLLLFAKLFQASIAYLDTFIICSRAIALASLLRLLTANITTGNYAMPIWGFLGIAIAGYKYYHVGSISAKKVGGIAE